jgi:hypothetical protein
MRFLVLTAASIKMAVFWVVAAVVGIIALMMEASSTSETSLNFCQTRGGQYFHYRGPHWLFTSLSRAAEKINNVVDSKRNYFFNSKSTARIHLKTDYKLSCISL